MCAPSPTPPDGPPVSAGSEGSLSAPLSETRSGFQILKCVVRISFARKDEAGEKVTSSEYPPDNLLNILQLCAPYRVVHKPACDK